MDAIAQKYKTSFTISRRRLSEPCSMGTTYLLGCILDRRGLKQLRVAVTGNLGFNERVIEKVRVRFRVS